MLAHLVCLGTHTITGLLGACGKQFGDWSADYRMYSRSRVSPQRLFDVVRQGLCELEQGPLVTAMDDTRIKKTGRKVHGARYTRDPLGPPFHTNFIRAQRFLQISAALCGGAKEGQARMLPIDWVHAPGAQKPTKKATPEQWAHYREHVRSMQLGNIGVQRLARMRDWMDSHGREKQPLWCVVDGSFTNGTVLKQLPRNTVLVGRIRADAKLYHLPEEQPPKGRRRTYGKQAPTPEAVRLDDAAHLWQDVDVYYGGQRRTLRAKRLGPLRWRAAGQRHDLQLIVIAPTPYRISPNSRLLYRQPAYLICTDSRAPLEEVVQRYLWRWDIETNFRDEKTILGIGEAQVRTPAATENVTATAVAAYAMLLLAAEQCRHEGVPIQHLPPPKWQKRKPRRATTANLIQNLRHELWAHAIHSSSFVTPPDANTKPKKHKPPLHSALFYAARYS